MQPSNEWQQQPPSNGPRPEQPGPYSVPAQPESTGPYSVSLHPDYTQPAYPASAVPYADPGYTEAAAQYPPSPAQYSAVPAQYSAPPAGYGQPNPASYDAYPAYPAAPPAGRGNLVMALIAGGAVVAVLAVAIVLVVAMRGDEETPIASTTPSSATTSAGPVDSCLVGEWRQTLYQHNVDLSGSDVGAEEDLGTIKMTGGGKKWTIKADGSAIEDDSETVYTGMTDDGREVEAKFSGITTWKLETKDRQIFFSGVSGDTEVVISVDGDQAGKIALEPNYDPANYTCAENAWRVTRPEDTSSLTTYERVT